MLAAERVPPCRTLTVPVEPASRLVILDALRGLALLGVLAINLETEFRVSIFRQFVAGPPERAVDRWIDAVLSTFVDMKAFALFSLLFGVGLAIQFERMGQTGRTMLVVRRLLVLLGFGLIHLALIWNGDILTEYALAGLIVLPFLFGPAWLPTLGSVVFLGLYLAQPLLPPLVGFQGRAWLLHQVAAADRVYATGSFLEILTFRIEEIAGFLPLHVFVLPRTLGLFLLGVVAWRSGLIRRAEHHVRALGWAACLAVGAGTVLTLATATRHYSGWPSLGRAEPVAALLGTIILALGYALAILAIGTTRAGRRGLAWAGPVGRMAFTNYIVQSLVLGLVFYGYGFGMFGRLDLATGLCLVLVIYGAQVVASRWWLRHHRFGPLEGLWRVLTYGRRPRLGA